jgi:hypothetical protein
MLLNHLLPHNPHPQCNQLLPRNLRLHRSPLRHPQAQSSR